jgi:hypothetical protein
MDGDKLTRRPSIAAIRPLSETPDKSEPPPPARREVTGRKENGVTIDHAQYAATKPVLSFLMGTE